jgi:hypothetical protein
VARDTDPRVGRVHEYFPECLPAPRVLPCTCFPLVWPPQGILFFKASFEYVALVLPDAADFALPASSVACMYTYCLAE